MTSDSLAEMEYRPNRVSQGRRRGEWEMRQTDYGWIRRIRQLASSLSFNQSINARMSADEFIDIFSFEVTSVNGSRLHIDSDLTQPVRYQIFRP